jgi:uncharacterized protein CbrC (UPF0167 family)
MSRRKDRERALAQKRLNPDYPGFRGYEHEPGRAGSIPLTTAICSVCGRRRNVPLAVAQEEGDKFVCMSCQQAGATSEALEAEDVQEEEVAAETVAEVEAAPAEEAAQEPEPTESR